MSSRLCPVTGCVNRWLHPFLLAPLSLTHALIVFSSPLPSRIKAWLPVFWGSVSQVISPHNYLPLSLSSGLTCFCGQSPCLRHLQFH